MRETPDSLSARSHNVVTTQIVMTSRRSYTLGPFLVAYQNLTGRGC